MRFSDSTAPRVNASPIAASSINPGNYAAKSGYIKNVKIAEWASEYILTGYVIYGGTRNKIEVPLRKETSTGKTNLFSGEGQIRQEWSTGENCFYSIRVDIFAYMDRIFIRDYSPSNIYIKWDANKGCPPIAGAYTWTISPEPYFWKK